MTSPKIAAPLVCLLACIASLLAVAAASAEDGMEWQFNKASDTKAVHLVYGVPETDNVQVSGICEPVSGAGAKASSITFGTDIGDLENGKEVTLRFSGGGFDHALPGQIHRASGEEGLSGVLVAVEHGDPLWTAMDEKESLDYLVPGYRAASLDLTRGRSKIKEFVQACRSSAETQTMAEAGAAPAKSDDDEKEAFESAKELGTVEAWEAFLANYSSGFRADLARAYIKKLGDQPQAPSPAAPPEAATATLDDFPMTAASWGGIVRSGPGRSYAKVGSLTENQPVTLLARTDVVEDGYPWFKLDFGGKTGFQWGGILCSTGAERPDLFKTCTPAAAKPAPTKAAPVKAAPPPAAKKKTVTRCGKSQVLIEGKCIAKRDAASYCGPGYRLQGNKCVQGYAKPKPQKQLPTWQLEAIAKGCRPGQGWNPQEGCHEND
jgi:hypothetical protein